MKAIANHSHSMERSETHISYIERLFASKNGDSSSGLIIKIVTTISNSAAVLIRRVLTICIRYVAHSTIYISVRPTNVPMEREHFLRTEYIKEELAVRSTLVQLNCVFKAEGFKEFIFI